MEALIAKTAKKGIMEDTALLNSFIQTASKNVLDKEIQEECNMARYGSRYGKPERNWEKDLKKVEEIKKRICLK